MNAATPTVIDRMQTLISRWEPAHDRRAVFLSCYAMMTANMIRAVEQAEFEHNDWVERLVCQFAEYYFDALDAAEQRRSVPDVWRFAFDAAQVENTHVLQHLILGMNAHINRDLVYVLYDILRDDWASLSEGEQAARYRDYCRVNDVIYRTIDAVQDEVVERFSPQMNLVDEIGFRLDEWLLHRMIVRWREQVWSTAGRLIACCEDDAPAVRQYVESQALLRSRAVMFEYGVFGLRLLF